MDKPAITYTPRADATPRSEADALAAIYKYVLAKKEAAPESRPNNAERRSSEIGAKSSSPRG